MMIKIISFDIGGTLLINDNNDKNNNYGLKELTDLLNLPYENVRNSYKKIFQTKKGSLNELIDIFCKELGIKHNQKLNEFFYNKFNQSQRGTISSENILLINTLKNEGYKIILFSNSCCLLNNDAINDIVDCIDDIFYSYDIGYTKDDEESYEPDYLSAYGSSQHHCPDRQDCGQLQGGTQWCSQQSENLQAREWIPRPSDMGGQSEEGRW